MTYHPTVNKLIKVIWDNMYLVNMNEEVRKTSWPRPMVSFQSAWKLSRYLVWTKLYPLQRKGSLKCYKWLCEVCNNVTDTTIFSSTVIGNIFKINHNLNCDGRFLIYFATCKQSNKQCMGETTDQFRNRWKNYKDNARKFDRKDSCMQEYLYKHFRVEDQKGLLNEASVIFIV